MRIPRILWAFLRAALLQETAYRAELLGNMVRSVIGIAVAVGGLAVVFSHTSSLSGWTLEQAMVLLGVYYLVQGVVQTALSPSLNEVVTEVRKGTFDYVLLKPVPSLLLSSTRRFAVWHLADVLLGGTVIAVGLIRLEAQITVGIAAVFFAVMVGGVAIVFSIWLALTTLVFWFVRIENITMIFQLFFDTGRYPRRDLPLLAAPAADLRLPRGLHHHGARPDHHRPRTAGRDLGGAARRRRDTAGRRPLLAALDSAATPVRQAERSVLTSAPEADRQARALAPEPHPTSAASVVR